MSDWFEEQLKSSWQVRWAFRAEVLKLTFQTAWDWVLDNPVWFFSEHGPGELRTRRTKRLIATED